MPRSLFYWRTTGNREIDFLTGITPNVVPIESKYSTWIDGDMKRVIRNPLGKGPIISRDVLELEGHIRVIPAAVVLALLP